MIHAVTTSSAACYRAALDEMHRQRARIFVDRLGWTIPVQPDGREIDQFDGPEAVYLLALDEAGACQGSLRLLPTTGPHILGDLFTDLCDGPVPRAEDCMEISRFCTAPDLSDPTLVRKELMVALVEYALLHEVRAYTCVTHAAAMAHLMAIGWDCAPLGPPRPDGAKAVAALRIRITPDSLSLLRDRAGFRSPVLRLETRHAA